MTPDARRHSRRPTSWTARIIRGRHALRPRLRKAPLAGLTLVVTSALAVGALVGTGALPAFATSWSTVTSDIPRSWATTYGSTGSAGVDQGTHVLYSADGGGIRAADHKPDTGSGNTPSSTTNTALVGAGNGIDRVAVDSANHLVYGLGTSGTTLYRTATAASESTGDITAYGQQSLATAASLGVSASGLAVEGTSGSVWAISPSGNSVKVWDPNAALAGSAGVRTISQTAPSALDTDSDRGYVFVGSSTPGAAIKVYRANSSYAAPVTTLAVPSGAVISSLSYDAVNKRLYAADSANGKIDEYDVASYGSTSLLRSISTTSGQQPNAIVVDGWRSELYVSYADTPGTMDLVDVFGSSAQTVGFGLHLSRSTSGFLALDQGEGIVWATTGSTMTLVYLAAKSYSTWGGTQYVEHNEIVAKGGVMPSGVGGQPYSGRLVVGLSWVRNMLGGGLPGGLSVDTLGRVSGTPTQAGEFTPTVQPSYAGLNVNGLTPSGIYVGNGTRMGISPTADITTLSNATFQIAPATPVISTTSLPGIPTGQSYSQSVAASWMDGTRYPSSWTQPSWSITSGSLPAGITLNPSTGTLSGTSSSNGSYSFTVRTTNPTGSDSHTYSITVGAVAPHITTTSLPSTYDTWPYFDPNTYLDPVLTATGGTPTWSITAGALPPGLSLDPATGAISGTTAAAGTFNFTVTATNSAGSDSKALSITADPLGPSGINGFYTAWIGVPFSQAMTGSGSVPRTWSVGSSNPLPPGLSLTDAAAGTVSGTPTGSANFYSTDFDLTNGAGSAGGQVSFNVLAAPANQQTTTASSGQSFSYPITSTSSTGPFSWYALAPGNTKPSWLQYTRSNGTLTGTPPAGTTGSTTFVVRVEDSNGSIEQIAVTVNWSPPVTLPAATLPIASDGVSYSSGSSITAIGGTGPYTYALTSSSTLPLGLSLDPSTGEITGSTFSIIGANGFSVEATDATNHTATQAYVLTIMQVPPSLPTLTLQNGTVGTYYATSVQASGTATINYSISSGSLPPGITQSGKNIGGTPTTVGSYTFTILAENDNSPFGSGSDSHSYTIVIDPEPISWSSATAPGAVTIGVPYSWTPNPSGTNITQFVITSGTLPAGLTLNTATGVISGTATAAGSFPITIGATNSLGTVTQSYTLASSLVAPTLAASGTAPAAPVGTAYSYQVPQTGGSPATSYSLTGTLPTGLSFNSSTGVISGTPAGGATTATVSVTATNSAGTSSAMSVTIPVTSLPVYPSTTTVAVGATGVSGYSASLLPSGVGPFTYSVITGSMPSGMSIDSSGNLVGTPPTPGTYTFTVQATNTNGSASTAVTFVTQAAPAAPATATAPSAGVGQAYSYTPTVTGTALAYSATGLPTGLTINSSTGVISGTTAAVGTSTIVVTASNLVGSVTSTITLASITAPTYSSSTATMTAGVTGTGYGQSVPVPTGTSPFTYAVTSGTLPAGLTLNPSTGFISGTPTSVNGGTSTFTVTASNPVGSANVAVSLTVNAPPSAASGVSLTAAIGIPVSATVPVQGTGPFTFTLASGALPAGVTMSSSGVLSGTPTTAGATSATYTVTNTYGSTQIPVAITVGAAPALPATTSLAGTVGSAFAGTVVPTTGAGPFTFAVTSGSLPAGLLLNTTTGAISGTPSTAGSSTAVISVTNAFGTASSTVGIAIAAAPSVPSSGGSSSGGSSGGSTSGGSGSTGSGSTGSGSTGSGSTGSGSTGSGSTGSGSTGSGSTGSGSTGSGSTGSGSTSGGSTGSGSTGTGSTSGGSTGSGSTGSGSTGSGSTAGGSTPAAPSPATPTPAAPAPAVNVGSVVNVATGGAASPLSATVGVAYSAALAASGAASGTTYAVQGSLPPGLSLSASTGTLSGTPSARGTYSFTVTGTSPSGAVTVNTVTLVVNAAGAPAFSVTPPTSTTVGSTWSVPGSTAGLTYAVRSGALPTGVSVNPATGALTGSPTAPGIYQFVLSASNGSSAAAAQAYSVMVTAPIGSVPDPNASVALQLESGASVSSAPAKITADGLLPGSAWTVVMHSKPVLLGTGMITTSGAVKNTVRLPKHVAVGTHHLVLSGVSVTGQLMTRTAEFVVTKKSTSGGSSGSGSTAGGSTSVPDTKAGPGSTAGTGGTGTKSDGGGLAWTGFEAAPLVGAGLLLALLGLALMLIGRRRRRA